MKKELEHILKLDQGVRELIQDDITQEKRQKILDKMDLTDKSLDDGVFTLMREIDSINLIKVEKIIDEHGYPGRDLVGSPANETVFYVIQHSKKIDKYLPLMRKAAENGDISKTELVMMEDRYLMNSGKAQIYGTQIRGINKDGEWIHFVWPIKNADSINELRKSIGLSTIEEYAALFDIEYKEYTLEQVNELH